LAASLVVLPVILRLITRAVTAPVLGAVSRSSAA
jgi:hypothetical protein